MAKTRFTKVQLLAIGTPDYINDIMLLQILVNERRNSLDMNSPLSQRLKKIASSLDNLKDVKSIDSLKAR